jgi:hypothetical protein
MTSFEINFKFTSSFQIKLILLQSDIILLDYNHLYIRMKIRYKLFEIYLYTQFYFYCTSMNILSYGYKYLCCVYKLK